MVAGGGVVLTGAMLQSTAVGRQVLQALGFDDPAPAGSLGKPFVGGVRVEQVRRPEDLLVVDLVLVNLATKKSGSTLFLEIADPGKRAYLAVVLPGQNVGETLGRSAGTPLSQTRLALPSVLAFRLPRGWRAPYDLPRLLDWSGLTPVWSAPGQEPQSRIEAPYRLRLQPDSRTVWQHAVDPVRRSVGAGTTEVWHTRLTGRTPGSGKPDQRSTTFRTVRVTTALTTSLVMPLTSGHRAQIVAKSKATPVSADRLILSSLGSTLELHGRWPDTDGLLAWDHRSTLGRDQYVKTVESGFLAPWGHRAAKVTETWRTMTSRDGRAVAVQQGFMTIVLLDPVVDTSLVKLRTGGAGGATTGCALPFQRVRSTVAVTGRLTPFGSGQVPLLYGTASSLTLPFVGTDWSGGEVPFVSRVMWVESIDDDLAWNQLNSSTRTVDLLGQRTAVAPGSNGSTTLPVSRVVVSVQGLTTGQVIAVDPRRARFRPQVDTLDAQLPGLGALAGPGTETGAVPHTYHPAYLTNQDNVGGIVLAVSTGGAARRTAAARRAPTGILPISRTGGMFSLPPYQGFSRLGGALLAQDPAAVTGAASGLLDPSAVFSGLTLLGGIPLRAIIPEISDGLDVLPAALPQVRHETVDGRQSVRMTITPPLMDASIALAGGVELRFVAGALSVDVSVLSGGPGPAEERFEARLTGCALQLGGVVVLPIDELRLASSSGHPLDVMFRPGDVSFLGPLAFVQQLAALVARLLRPEGAARPAPTQRVIALPGPAARTLDPDVDVSLSGIHLGLGLALSDVAVGVFTLGGLRFGLGVEIPFSQPQLVVDLAFATHDDPFVVTFGPFGGGGYLALRLRGGEVDNLEVSLLVAGGVGVNLGVAAGAIAVQAGFVLALPAGQPVAVTAFFRASGSLEVLGLVSLSVVFEIALQFVDTSPSTLTGTATLQLKVKVLCCSKTVKASVSRTFAGGNPGTPIGQPPPASRGVGGAERAAIAAPPDRRVGFLDTYPQAAPWQAYAAAFAPTTGIILAPPSRAGRS